MGTSNSNIGQNGATPLVPSWLDDETPNNDPIPGPQDGDRFRAPRSDFTRYINSNVRDLSSLRRAASRYVSGSLKGSNNATKRLGSALKTSSNIVGVLSGFSKNGVNYTLKSLNLEHLQNHSPIDMLLELSEYFCPDGGPIDEGIARDAYFDTLCDIPEEMIDLSNLTLDMILGFIELYFSNVIKARLINDIGLNIIKLPDSVTDIQNLENQVFLYIRGAVKDAIHKQDVKNRLALDTDTLEMIENIYRTTYELLEAEEE